MPIRASQRDLYPPQWDALSRWIRFGRARGRCENRLWVPGDGFQSSLGDDGRCAAVHGEPHPVTGSRVVLTTAHINHNPRDCWTGNLIGMCQRCHLWWDLEHHARTRALGVHAGRLEAGQTVLFDVPVPDFEDPRRLEMAHAWKLN